METATNRNTIDISAKIKDLNFHVGTDIGVVRAIVSVSLKVLIKRGQMQLLDGVYDSGDQYGVYFKRGWELLGNGQEYETHYSRTVYKALLVALDKAMLDVTKIIDKE